MFPGVLAYCLFLCSSRFIGFISYRTSKIQISKSATISGFIIISQDLNLSFFIDPQSSLQLLKFKEYSYL